MGSFSYEGRIKKCTELMHKFGLDVLLLGKPANMYYLTGDGRLCSYAMITRDGKIALGVPATDVKDVSELALFDQIAGFESEVGMIHSLAHYYKYFGLTEGTVGLEYTFLTQAMMSMFTHPHGKPEGLLVKDCTPVMSELRIVKDDLEIERMKKAAQVADIGMQAAADAVKAGVTESQVAAAAEYAMRNAGAEGFWRTYVASGPRTNIAHGVPTNRRLAAGDLVMIDLHPIVNSYSSDLCRTVCVGQPMEEQLQTHGLFLHAQQETISKVREGASIANLEEEMHQTFKEAGHDQHIFGPPIHGVGIEFEEAPLPPGHAFFHGEKGPGPLEVNTVISVGNCGLYTGPWGVRVEDTVAVGKGGPVVLTNFPREIQPIA